jgi:capsular polysaccharide biosynthesis protein
MKPRSLEQELNSIRGDLDSGALPAALLALKRVMSHAPLSQDAQFLLGKYFWRRGQNDRALVAMKWAVTCAPSGLEGCENLALLASTTGNAALSAIYYRWAVIAGASAHDLLSKISVARDRRELRAALCLLPHDAEVACFLTVLEAGMLEPGPLRRRMKQAGITAALAGSTKHVETLAVSWGRSLQAKSRFSEAAAHLRGAILINPAKPDRIFDFGRSEFENGHLEIAGRQALRKLLISPIDPGLTHRETRSLVARHPAKIEDRPGYRCRELAKSFSVKIEPVIRPGPRIDYRVPATFLARADEALLLAGHHSVILPDDTVLMEGMTYRLKRRQWDGPCYAYVSEDDEILAALPAPEPRITGEAVLLGCGGNYYHNIVDWLSRLPTILETPELAELPILVSSNTPPSIIETLEMLGLERGRLKLLKSGLFPVDRLWIPSLGHGRQGCASPRYLEFLEEKLFKRFRDPRAKGTRRLYYRRRSDGHRAIINAEAVDIVLKKFGFETIGLEGLSAVEQFSLAAEAEVVVAPFGAGLTNILASPTTCKVIELTHHLAVRPLFPILAGLRGQAFHRVTGRPVGAGSEHVPMHAEFEVPIGELEKTLRRVLA